MSSTAFAAAIDLAPRPSVRALTWILWLHLLPLAALPFAMQPGVPMLALIALFGLSWLRLRRHPAFGFGPRALTRLLWHSEGHWTLDDASGRREQGELLGSSYRHPGLLVLNFQFAGGGRATRILLGDELEPEVLRRLRARLGMWRPPAAVRPGREGP